MTLEWKVGPEGWTLAVRSNAGPIPVETWAEYPVLTRDGRSTHPGPVFRLLDDGEAEESGGGRVRIAHPVVAALSVYDGRALGLPPRLDWPLVIHLDGLPIDPDAHASWYFEGPDARPMLIQARTGCFAKVDGREHRLASADFAAIQRLEQYNGTAGHDREARLVAWGTVTDELPDGVRTDEFLREFRVATAEVITLQPFVNDRGEADFDPIPGVWAPSDEDDGPGADQFETRIPEAGISRFRERFRRHGVRSTQALGGGWYLTTAPELEAVLRELKTIQGGSPTERLEFLRNPEAILRDRNPGLDEEALTRVFASEDYSARVEGTGIWKPPVLPWVQKEPEAWLPEERLGIRIGDRYVAVDPKDVRLLVEALEKARSEGRPIVDYKGTPIPATEEAIGALRHLTGIAEPEPGEEAETPPEEEEETRSPDRVVLMVSENFHQVEFHRGTAVPLTAVDFDLSAIPLQNDPLEHQRTAIQWLVAHWAQGSPGVLLADDMGLGKTFQVLAFMAWLRSEMTRGRMKHAPMLVVAPTGLLENWVQEHTTHLPGVGLGPVLRAFGVGIKELREGQGRETDAGIPLLNLDRMRRAAWILTTYETLRDYQHSFGRLRFALSALDEVQKAKNPRSGISQAIKTVNARFTVCITGTPVENRLAELWNILDIARPGELGSLREFSRRYEQGDGVGEGALSDLKQHLIEGAPPVMVRRMKGDHLKGLPKKYESYPRLEMPGPQEQAYSQVLEVARSGNGSRDGRGAMLSVLAQLRNVSLHPFIQTNESDDEYVASSARLKAATATLDEVHSRGEKALLFLESRDMQGTLAGLLKRRYSMSRRPMIINGAVTGPKRQERVNRFQKRDGFDVLILSPRAGGLGLTLTAANQVIHLSRWWNPAVEDQCTDRVYRIGQERPVHIHFPLAVHPGLGEGSFDVILDRLLRRKRELSRAVLAPSSLSTAEIQEIFRAVLSSRQEKHEGPTTAVPDLETFSPLEFEDWVLGEFRAIGYTVERTPPTHDGGVDGIARPPAHSPRPAVLVQCKHTQVGRAQDEAGVLEIVSGQERYGDLGRCSLLVVTNATGFSARARELAEEYGVVLVDRSQLGSLKRMFDAA